MIRGRSTLVDIQPVGSVIDLERAGEVLMSMDMPVPAQAGIVVATI